MAIYYNNVQKLNFKKYISVFYFFLISLSYCHASLSESNIEVQYNHKQCIKSTTVITNFEEQILKQQWCK